MKRSENNNTIKKSVALLMAALLLLSFCGCAKATKFSEEEALKILDNFSPLAEIPRQSGSCEAVGNYLYNWAKEKGFDAEKDSSGNVIFNVPGSGKGASSKKVTVLQAHMDMVCLPQPEIFADESINYVMGPDGEMVPEDSLVTGSAISESASGAAIVSTDAAIETSSDAAVETKVQYNPLTDEIIPVYSEGKLYAKDTSLGADNGIGIAIILDYLEEEHDHGPLRIIFTVDEETDMNGASSLDAKYLEDASYMINFDNKECGTIITSSFAEKQYSVFTSDIEKEELSHDSVIGLRIKGLKGGSAAQSAPRISANTAIVKCLKKAKDDGVDFRLSYIYGGYYDDQISKDTTAIIAINDADLRTFWNSVKSVAEEYTAEYGQTDPNLTMSISDSIEPDFVFSKDETARILDSLYELSLAGTTTDSAVNIGKLRMGISGINFTLNLRSSTNEVLEQLYSQEQEILSRYNMTLDESYSIPAWNSTNTSVLKNAASKYYKQLTKNKAELVNSRESSECGFFAEKTEKLEIISIGPSIFDAHSTEEFCNMESALLVKDWITAVLKDIGGK